MSDRVLALRKKNYARRQKVLASRLTRMYGGKQLIGGFETLSGILQLQEQVGNFKDLTIAETERLYCRHAVVFACVRRIITAFIEADLQVGSEGKEGFEPLEEHPMLALMDRPNPDMSQSEFFSRFTMHLLVTGVSYIWERRNRGKQVAELWPLPTSWVERRFVDGKLDHFRVNLSQNAFIEVPIEDMVVIGFPDPKHPSQYCGPLQAASRELQIDEERGNYLFEMLTNMHAPGMILFQPESFTPEQKLEARAVLEERVGQGRRGSPLFVEGENARVEMQAPLKDLDWPGVTALSETRICAAFGVPPIVISLKSGIDKATYSNYEQAIRAFYQGIMPPLWRMVADSFTRDLLFNEGDQENKFLFDFSLIPQFQEDADKRSARAVSLFKGGVATRNEVRAMVGLDPLADIVGDVLMVPANVLEEPADGSARLEQEEAEEDDTEEAARLAAEAAANLADNNNNDDDDDNDDSASKVKVNGKRSKWHPRL